MAVDDAEGLAGFAAGHDVDLVVVGPEAPLVAGLADQLRDRGLAVFGPGRRAAAIEGSKAFAKRLMAEHGIPTARFATFTDPAAARRFARDLGGACVVKTDGLAAGKGAIVCATLDEADAAIAQCLERREFGAAGATVVVEEFMHGEEASFFVLGRRRRGAAAGGGAGPQDRLRRRPRPQHRRHGRVHAGGGRRRRDAGARHARDRRARRWPRWPARARRITGVLYVGLMLTATGPKVVEFNCRFGDPECQALMMAMDEDLVPLLVAVARGDRLPAPPAEMAEERAAVCVAIASGGYPGRYTTGQEISGIEAAEAGAGVQVFQAGTAKRQGRLVTAAAACSA